MKVMKYFGPYESMFGLQISVCMISNMVELLLAPFFDLLVCLPLMQSTQLSKLVKSKVLSTLSFTNLLILSMDMCPNLRCHKIEQYSCNASLNPSLLHPKFLYNFYSLWINSSTLCMYIYLILVIEYTYENCYVLKFIRW